MTISEAVTRLIPILTDQVFISTGKLGLNGCLFSGASGGSGTGGSLKVSTKFQKILINFLTE